MNYQELKHVLISLLLLLFLKMAFNSSYKMNSLYKMNLTHKNISLVNLKLCVKEVLSQDL